MRNQKLLGGAVAVVSAGLLFAGCGTRAPEGGGAGGKVVKIGAISPATGGLSAIGVGMRNSVELAIKQANASNAIPGWKIEMAARDDEGKPDVGLNAATNLASDDAVVGVVGAYNSSVSQKTIPVLEAAKIVQISPANTGPILTMGENYQVTPKRTYKNFFRTVTTDAIQGKFAANYLLKHNIKRLATIHDKKIYGQGLVDSVTRNFIAGGGKIVKAETINPDDLDYGSVISKVKAADPDAVFYGGEYPQSGPLTKQMKAAGLKVPLVGGDGDYDPTYIQLAGAAAEGDLATSVGEPADRSEAAQQFRIAYQQAGFKEPYSAYGPASYDAANAIINALKQVLPTATDVKSAREKVIEAVGKSDFNGATGPVSFDQFGDTNLKIISIFRAEDGKWKFLESEDLSQD